MPVNARLFRSRDDRMVAGVAGGLAAFLNIDPSLVRILWVVLIPLTGGLILLLYLAMALIVPEQRFDDERWRAWDAQAGGQSAGPWPAPESNDPAWPGAAAFAAQPPPSAAGEPASDSPLDAEQLVARDQDDATRAFEPATEQPASADVTLPPGSAAVIAGPGPAWPTPPPDRGTTWPRPAERRHDRTAPLVFGLILVFIGAVLLARTYLPGIDWGLTWPILFVGIGIALLIGSVRRSAPP